MAPFDALTRLYYRMKAGILPLSIHFFYIGRVRARFSNEMPLKLNLKNAFEQTRIGLFSK